MKQRCSNANCKSYPNYGGRGITVCDEWRMNYMAFHNWAMANRYRENLTLHRIDNDGIYVPSNCRWIPLAEQARNRRKPTNIYLVSLNAETKSLTEWSKLLGINYQTAYRKLKHGSSPEEVLIVPVRERKQEVAANA